MRCEVCWNPGKWPYTTRCVHDKGHEGNHRDKDGNEIPNVEGQEGR